MTSNSLLAHLSSKLTTQSENIATESLLYILSKSSNAKNGLKKVLLQIDIRITSDLHYASQVYDEDQAIPDLVGYDDVNNTICVIESKFWAGLTDNQPNTYLKRLTEKEPATLLFIAPEVRRHILWSELLQKVEADNKKIESNDKNSNINILKIDGVHSLALTSWEFLLNNILMELDVAGDTFYKADVLQLKGLCDKMDTEAFLPIKAEEITTSIARRNMQFADLVDKAVEIGCKTKLFSFTSPDKVRGIASHAKNYYCRSFYARGFSCSLYLDDWAWANWHNTPIWLTILDGDFDKEKATEKINKALSILELESPKKLYHNPNGYPFIPIILDSGVEEDTVIQSIIKQIESVIDLLEKHCK